MPKQQDRIIVADIGGTNGRFALAEVEGGPEGGGAKSGPEGGKVHLHQAQTLDNAAYSSLAELLGDYIGRLDGAVPERACLAIAGPSDGRHGTMVNLPWRMDAEELEQRFGLADVRLVNDFAAQAAMVCRLPEDETHCLNPGVDGGEDVAAAVIKGPVAVCGPGTGLGVGLSVPTENGRIVVRTEGGHVRFSASTPLERELRQYLKPDSGYLAAEDAWSGPGIARIYRFFCDRAGEPCRYDSPAAISAAALDGSDTLCREALDCFLGGLGATAGDVVLAHGATGGLYLAGGILPQILPLLEQSDFLARFFDHGPLEDYLRAVPVHLVTSGTTALRGAAHLYFDARAAVTTRQSATRS